MCSCCSLNPSVECAQIGVGADLWTIEEVGEDRMDLGQCRLADFGGFTEAVDEALSADS
jgi:hypothetical protein